MKLPQRVRIAEVGPRDGLQSLERMYPTEVKLELIDILASAGIETIEVTGFVRSDVIPQLSDAAELFARLERRPGTTYRALVPNLKGARRAADVKVDEMLGLIVASDSYSKKNSNMTVEENLEQLVQMAAVSRESEIPLVVAIGCAMFCPYEGDTPPERVLDIIDRLWGEGIRSFYVATSVGLDGPGTVYHLCTRIMERWPALALGVHLHNTNGMALANAFAGALAGAQFFEGSICGIGGGIRMPYGMAPYGNVSTEDLVHMFAESGVDTGLELDAVLGAARRIKDLLGLETTHSYALQGATKATVLEQGKTAARR